MKAAIGGITALALLGIGIMIEWRPQGEAPRIHATDGIDVVRLGETRPRPAATIASPTPTPAPTPVPPAADPMAAHAARLARLIAFDQSFAADFRAVRREPRDPVWAPRMEAELSRRYTAALTGQPHGQLLDVRCATTVCAVIGDLPEAIGGDAQGKAMHAVQAHPLVRGIDDLGFQTAGGGIGQSASDNRQIYVMIWKRRPPS